MSLSLQILRIENRNMYVEKFPLQEMQGRRNKNLELTFTVVDIPSCWDGELGHLISPPLGENANYDLKV